MPTYKEQFANIREQDINTYGFLGYPLLQAADILMYRQTPCPSVKIQVPHVELTREVARRFNQAFGSLILREVADSGLPTLAAQTGIATAIEKSHGGKFLQAESVSPAKKREAIQTAFRTALLEEKALYLNNGLGTCTKSFRSLKPCSPRRRACPEPTAAKCRRATRTRSF